MLTRSKIARYAADPAAGASDVKALKGMRGVSRLRVGNRGVLFTETGVVIAVAGRIRDGENRIRVWRDHRGIAPAALAEAAAVTPETLADIEAGRREAGSAVVRRIAAKLNLSLDDLVG